MDELRFFFNKLEFFLIFSLSLKNNSSYLCQGLKNKIRNTMRGTKVTFDSDKLHYSSELMRALAHPLRLKILEFIDDHKSINVNKIYSNLDLEQSITSQHLKILRMSGVVSVEVTGKFHIYQINYDVINKASFAVNKFVGKA